MLLLRRNKTHAEDLARKVKANSSAAKRTLKSMATATAMLHPVASKLIEIWCRSVWHPRQLEQVWAGIAGTVGSLRGYSSFAVQPGLFDVLNFAILTVTTVVTASGSVYAS